jgi:hypothetical protein
MVDAFVLFFILVYLAIVILVFYRFIELLICNRRKDQTLRREIICSMRKVENFLNKSWRNA